MVAPGDGGCDKARVVRGKLRSSLLICMPLLLAGGCTAQVYNPAKTPAQAQADIDFCSRQANHDYWYDPIAALYHAYDCLEDKGYKRSGKDLASQVEQAFGEARKEQARPVAPCRVPCLPPKPRAQ